MNTTRIRKQMEELDIELYGVEVAIDNAFTTKEVDELKRKKDRLLKRNKKLQRKLENAKNSGIGEQFHSSFHYFNPILSRQARRRRRRRW